MLHARFLRSALFRFDRRTASFNNQVLARLFKLLIFMFLFYLNAISAYAQQDADNLISHCFHTNSITIYPDDPRLARPEGHKLKACVLDALAVRDQNVSWIDNLKANGFQCVNGDTTTCENIITETLFDWAHFRNYYDKFGVRVMIRNDNVANIQLESLYIDPGGVNNIQFITNDSAPRARK